MKCSAFRIFFEEIAFKIENSVVSSNKFNLPKKLEEQFEFLADTIQQLSYSNGKIMLIGNGGSAAIASHGAIDFFNSVGMKSLAFSDISTTTCLSNDYGYESLFSRQIDMFGEKGDILIAISSSGQSANIINGVKSARKKLCSIITFTGFKPDNPLHIMGDISVYVPSYEYGVVEVVHQVILHAITDYLSRCKTEAAERGSP